jgi:CHAD domain-containing protein
VGVAAPAAVAFGRNQHMLAQGGEQMTTDRTAIRRWLAVGGAAHRPPWSARKRRHRLIVAPLAATLAATAAVGVGVALARAGNERRSLARRRREGRLRLAAREQLAAGLRRMALAQAELALDRIAAEEIEDLRRAVHETRKAIKRMRTIVRLLDGQLGERVCAREQATLRRAAIGLAGARDAEVMLNTLDGLLARRPDRLAGRKGIVRLRRHLRSERDRAEMLLHGPAARLQTAAELRAFYSRAAAWQLEDRPGIATVEDGLRHIYGQGRKRRKRARSGGTRKMHQWRKRVKDLRYAAEMLQREDAKWLRRLAKQADSLGELLGEEHDLATLAAWLQGREARALAGRRTRRRLLELIDKRRKKLRREAHKAGKRLYGRSPSAFVSRVERAYRRGAKRLS